ncbi:dihydroxyacetone kinase phosphoryl donor subunit DhaM [Brachybacterium hainanense]|uniref:phosphoenolpyruvate--glycerone phosphotransferase n=1 Tax=Brachybacterium hainanense TaxID=1541174 RepID=A0ABV6RBV4_9MICO
MTGIVVVSHSRPLAHAAVDLALEMVRDGAPPLAIAAGIEDEGAVAIGTDAAAIAGAIDEVADAQGVVVLMDLGSAVLSAQTALEFLDPDLAGRVHLSCAPLVEGMVGAVVAAAAGADADEVAGQAEIAVEAKRLQLGI